MPRAAACLLFLALALAAAPAEPSLDFIHLTDTHVIDDTGIAMPIAVARMHFFESGKRLAAFLPATRQHAPAFFLVTGDLIDAFRMQAADGGFREGQVEAFRKAVDGSPAPLYLALGNHDICEYGIKDGKLTVGQAAEAARAAWSRQFACFRRGTYYGFTRRVGRASYRFLVLEAAGAAAITPEQARWIRRQIASRGNAAVILAMHFPLAANPVSDSIREAAGGGGVVLALSGHVHQNGIAETPFGAKSIVQVRTAAFGYGDENWRKVRLHEDRIEIFAPGPSESVEKTIALPAAQPAASSDSRRAPSRAASISAR